MDFVILGLNRIFSVCYIFSAKKCCLRTRLSDVIASWRIDRCIDDLFGNDTALMLVTPKYQIEERRQLVLRNKTICCVLGAVLMEHENFEGLGYTAWMQKIDLNQRKKKCKNETLLQYQNSENRI